MTTNRLSTHKKKKQNTRKAQRSSLADDWFRHSEGVVGCPRMKKGNEGGKVLVVGVKFDSESRELLTWTLMKLANPGDRLIALHVLNSSESSSGTSSLLSLVNTFDSLLAVYQGFCNLKQVDLKLKVCRGGPVKKIVVKEAKESGASKVVVGTSKPHHALRSSTSVANYCARKLSNTSEVFAVTNGKIVFHKHSSNQFTSPFKDKFNQNVSQTAQEAQNNDDGDNSLALVPHQGGENVLVSKGSKQGWSLLRWAFLPKKQNLEKSNGKKTSMLKWVLKLPSRNTSSVVYPDQKQCVSNVKENNSSNVEDCGVIVPVDPQINWYLNSPSRGEDELPEELRNLHDKYSSTCRLFTYEELSLATSNFKLENLVGKGGSSHVYKGCLPDGKELAVKILKPSPDVLKEFVVEIEIISTLHHENIISLLGFCFENNNLLLVYDFLSRGSLEENLHGNKKDWNAFGWHERHKVALGVAHALDYLHNVSNQPVIHRDVKSSNILLSDDFEPQLSDFGLANWASTSSSHITCTDVSGTFGYLAPEYFMHGKVSDKVDVFAFGVVLLELLSGRMPIHSESPKARESLVMWAKPILERGELSELLDTRIECECNSDEIERMVLAATLCIRHSPIRRPQINLVLKLLQGQEEATNWARKEVEESKDVNATDEEAFPRDIHSHLTLALLDSGDDSISCSSTDQVITIEDYLKGRWTQT